MIKVKCWKIEQYDTEITNALVDNYKVIIENLGEDDLVKV
jgi:hypothetical protein